MVAPMRIGLVTGEYPPAQGGVGDFSAQLVSALTAQGNQVHVITTQPEGSVPVDTSSESGNQQARGVTVHRTLSSWGWRCWRRIAALAGDLELDVLNVQYQAAAYDMQPGINMIPQPGNRPPAVVTFHDLKVPYLFPKAGPLRWWMVRRLARQADAVIVTNEEDRLQLSNEMDLRKLHVVPIGSNIVPTPLHLCGPAAERGRWGVEPEDLLLGFFGFLNESKGFEDLIRALALLVEQGLSVHLLKIGGRLGTADPTNRAYAESIDRLIGALGLTEQVHWTGYSSRKEISDALLATDVCVLPFRDGVSFRRGSLLACLAHGRAVVTTHPRVQLQRVEDGKTMLLVDPGDPSGLAEAVHRLSRNPELRARLEGGARTLAEEFSWEQIADRTLVVLSRAMGNSA